MSMLDLFLTDPTDPVERAQARAAALREAADLLADRGYHLPADLVLRLPAQSPTPACTCRAETVHQAGCDTGLGA